MTGIMKLRDVYDGTLKSLFEVRLKFPSGNIYLLEKPIDDFADDIETEYSDTEILVTPVSHAAIRKGVKPFVIDTKSFEWNTYLNMEVYLKEV